MAVAASPNGQRLGVSFITSAFVSKQLKLVANKAHGISAKEDLKKFTPHSPRVGACVLLHQLKKPADFIKKRLRWRSDTYQDYLRHIDDVASEFTVSLKDYFS